MAAPNYVPVSSRGTRSYESPPRRDESWLPERPGDLAGGQPAGAGLGYQGPDQGYALKLVRRFADGVHLVEGERWDDVAIGGVLVGLKRASIFGRAPAIHDVEIGLRVWGFLDPDPDPELVALRRRLFDRIDDPHHYRDARRIPDAVPDSALRSTPAAVEAEHQRDWRALLDPAVVSSG